MNFELPKAVVRNLAIVITQFDDGGEIEQQVI